MTMAPPSPARVSKAEVAILGVVVLCASSLLLPAMPASREAARANLCRRNLRWLDLATIDYIERKRELPEVSWPVDLLYRLQDPVDRARHRQDKDIFRMSRPMFMTCPSRGDTATSDNPLEQTSHYTLVIDRDPRIRRDRVRWKYRDRPMSLPKKERDAWYIGHELSWAEAEEQLQSSVGPHASGAFLESDAKGNSVVRELVR